MLAVGGRLGHLGLVTVPTTRSLPVSTLALLHVLRLSSRQKGQEDRRLCPLPSRVLAPGLGRKGRAEPHRPGWLSRGLGLHKEGRVARETSPARKVSGGHCQARHPGGLGSLSSKPRGEAPQGTDAPGVQAGQAGRLGG